MKGGWSRSFGDTDILIFLTQEVHNHMREQQYFYLSFQHTGSCREARNFTNVCAEGWKVRLARIEQEIVKIVSKK